MPFSVLRTALVVLPPMSTVLLPLTAAVLLPPVAAILLPPTMAVLLPPKDGSQRHPSLNCGQGQPKGEKTTVVQVIVGGIRRPASSMEVFMLGRHALDCEARNGQLSEGYLVSNLDCLGRSKVVTDGLL